MFPPNENSSYSFTLISFKSMMISSSLSSADIGTELVVHLLVAAIVARYFRLVLRGMSTNNACRNS